MKVEQTEGSETSAYEIQTPGNYAEENIQQTEHGESLKSRMYELYGQDTTIYFFTQNSTLGIQLHVSAPYIGHRQYNLTMVNIAARNM